MFTINALDITEDFSKITSISGFFNIISPNDSIFYSRKVEFNLICNNTCNRIEFINHNDNNLRFKILCSNCKSYGLDRIRKFSVNEGENNLEFHAYDNSGNVYSINKSFIVESILPKILKTEPRQGYITNGSDFYILYSEENLVDITLVYGEHNSMRELTQTCTKGKNQECYFKPDLSFYDGEEIYFYFIVKDPISEIKTSETMIKVDTKVPIFTIHSPIPGNFYEKTVPINISANEKVKIEYKDNKENNANFRTLCTNCDSYGFLRIGRKNFMAGSHEIIFRVSDKAGNYALKTIDFISE